MQITRFIETRFLRAATVAVLLCASGAAWQALAQPRAAAGNYPLPTITTQPASRSVSVGQTATFTVAAYGSPPLTFQWRKNGVAISGATSLSYTTPVTTASYNDTEYTVVVTDVGGSVISNAAVLTVEIPLPTITQQPASSTVYAGQTASFSVVAGGTGPFTYQWRENGTAISGATSASYTTSATTTAENWSQFTVVVSNHTGSIYSKAAVLTVEVALPTITQQPVGRTVAVGQTAGFEVAASGTPPVTFQWRQNGADISGATGLTYFTPATTAAYNGAQYSVAVTDAGGTVISKTAVLTVDSAQSSALSSSATSLAFGSVDLSTPTTKTATLTNTGTSSVTISSVVMAGAGFAATGVSPGLVLSAGQSATLSTTFDPAVGGAVTGSVTVTSNASDPQMVISLSGTGVVSPYSVSLHWTASTSSVIGYNVYSGTTSGGPYTKITSTPVDATSYTDGSVQSGKTYYFVVTSVNSENQESAHSGQVSAVIP
jgi:Abnormal spindle-like microcephaly-assoc'd, ASPM-SPD-2-Hydin/Immunoglobulin domain/Immunoglobulin I-set domain